MKPSPGAEPVRMYKSPYGGKYGGWRLADCVPMREVKPQTEKQRQASARLGLLARLDSGVLSPAQENLFLTRWLAMTFFV